MSSVILSEARASRSEAPAQSKDPIPAAKYDEPTPAFSRCAQRSSPASLTTSQVFPQWRDPPHPTPPDSSAPPQSPRPHPPPAQTLPPANSPDLQPSLSPPPRDRNSSPSPPRPLCRYSPPLPHAVCRALYSHPPIHATPRDSTPPPKICRPFAF